MQGKRTFWSNQRKSTTQRTPVRNSTEHEVIEQGIDATDDTKYVMVEDQSVVTSQKKPPFYKRIFSPRSASANKENAPANQSLSKSSEESTNNSISFSNKSASNTSARSTGRFKGLFSSRKRESLEKSNPSSLHISNSGSQSSQQETPLKSPISLPKTPTKEDMQEYWQNVLKDILYPNTPVVLQQKAPEKRGRRAVKKVLFSATPILKGSQEQFQENPIRKNLVAVFIAAFGSTSGPAHTVYPDDAGFKEALAETYADITLKKFDFLSKSAITREEILKTIAEALTNINVPNMWNCLMMGLELSAALQKNGDDQKLKAFNEHADAERSCWKRHIDNAAIAKLDNPEALLEIVYTQYPVLMGDTSLVPTLLLSLGKEDNTGQKTLANVEKKKLEETLYRLNRSVSEQFADVSGSKLMKLAYPAEEQQTRLRHASEAVAKALKQAPVGSIEDSPENSKQVNNVLLSIASPDTPLSLRGMRCNEEFIERVQAVTPFTQERNPSDLQVDNRRENRLQPKGLAFHDEEVDTRGKAKDELPNTSYSPNNNNASNTTITVANVLAEDDDENSEKFVLAKTLEGETDLISTAPTSQNTSQNGSPIQSRKNTASAAMLLQASNTPLPSSQPGSPKTPLKKTAASHESETSEDTPKTPDPEAALQNGKDRTTPSPENKEARNPSPETLAKRGILKESAFFKEYVRKSPNLKEQYQDALAKYTATPGAANISSPQLVRSTVNTNTVSLEEAQKRAEQKAATGQSETSSQNIIASKNAPLSPRKETREEKEVVAAQNQQPGKNNAPAIASEALARQNRLMAEVQQEISPPGSPNLTRNSSSLQKTPTKEDLIADLEAFATPGRLASFASDSTSKANKNAEENVVPLSALMTPEGKDESYEEEHLLQSQPVQAPSPKTKAPRSLEERLARYSATHKGVLLAQQEATGQHSFRPAMLAKEDKTAFTPKEMRSIQRRFHKEIAAGLLVPVGEKVVGYSLHSTDNHSAETVKLFMDEYNTAIGKPGFSVRPVKDDITKKHRHSEITKHNGQPFTEEEAHRHHAVIENLRPGLFEFPTPQVTINRFETVDPKLAKPVPKPKQPERPESDTTIVYIQHTYGKDNEYVLNESHHDYYTRDPRLGALPENIHTARREAVALYEKNQNKRQDRATERTMAGEWKKEGLIPPFDKKRVEQVRYDSHRDLGITSTVSLKNGHRFVIIEDRRELDFNEAILDVNDEHKKLIDVDSAYKENSNVRNTQSRRLIHEKNDIFGSRKRMETSKPYNLSTATETFLSMRGGEKSFQSLLEKERSEQRNRSEQSITPTK